MLLLRNVTCRKSIAISHTAITVYIVISPEITKLPQDPLSKFIYISLASTALFFYFYISKKTLCKFILQSDMARRKLLGDLGHTQTSVSHLPLKIYSKHCVNIIIDLLYTCQVACYKHPLLSLPPTFSCNSF